LTEAVAAASEELESAKQADNQRQAERRRLKEIAEHGAGGPPNPAAANELKLAELEANVSEQALTLRRMELENAKGSVEVHKTRITLLEETVAIVEKDTVFFKSDLESQLVDVNKQEEDLKREIESAESALQALEQQRNAAHQKLNSQPKPTPALIEE